MRSHPDTRPQAGHSWQLVFAVSVLALLALTLHLDAPVLSNIHETRVLETAREMVVSQDWVVPRFNGELRLKKPPLPYWASASAFSLAGTPSVLAARLVVALLGAIMLLATYLIGRAIEGPRLGILAAATLVSGVLFLDAFHTVTPDVYLAATTSLAIAGFAWSMRRGGWHGFMAFAAGYAGLGLALLAKGPIALVFIALGAWFTRPAQGRVRRHWSVHSIALLLAILPVVVWAVLLIQQATGGLDVWLQEVLGRVTGEMGGKRSPWYYLPILLSGVSPLLVIFIASLFHARGTQSGLRSWFLIGFVFLLFLSSRKAAYLLPLLPAAALLVAHTINCADGSVLLRRVITTQVLVNALLAAALLGAAWALREHFGNLDRLLGAVLLITTLYLALVWSRPQLKAQSAVVILLSAILITTFYEHVLKTHLPTEQAFYTMGELIQHEVPADAELLIVGKMDPRISFYANRLPQRTISSADVYRGLSTRQRWILSDQALDPKAGGSWKRRFYTQTRNGHPFILYQVN